MAQWKGPLYFRINRNEVPDVADKDYRPTLGKAYLLRDGQDLTFVCNGMGISPSMMAAEVLKTEGIGVRVLEVHTVKPLDEEGILQCASETGAIVTVEEHSIIGGLGGAVAELISSRLPLPVLRVGI